MQTQTRNRKRPPCSLTVTSLRGWLIYKPLNALMAMKTSEPNTLKNTPRMLPQFGCETHQGKTLKAFPWLALVLSVIFCLANASPVGAQALNVTVAGLGCNGGQFSLLSFAWGASNPVTLASNGSGLGSGKASISSFNVTKAFDGCSPALFGGTVTGSHFATLTMVQTDKKNVVLTTVTLSDVIVESIQWSASAADAQTSESLSFAFAKVCIQDGPSGNKLCYNTLTNTTF